MISREDAVEALTDIIMDVEEKEPILRDIMRCIVAEESGLHIWGADDEEVKWLFAYPPGINDPDHKEFIEKCDNLFKKYQFEPSWFEKEKEGK